MKILIVEDDPGIASFLVKGLKAEGYATQVAADGREALAVVASNAEPFDLMLLDLGLPGASGLDVLWSVACLGTPTRGNSCPPSPR